MQATVATAGKAEKERIQDLVNSARALLWKQVKEAEGLSLEEQLTAEDLMEQLWQRLDFLTPAEMTKLLLRDILVPESQAP